MEVLLRPKYEINQHLRVLNESRNQIGAMLGVEPTNGVPPSNPTYYEVRPPPQPFPPVQTTSVLVDETSEFYTMNGQWYIMASGIPRRVRRLEHDISDFSGDEEG